MEHTIEDFLIGDIVNFKNNDPEKCYKTNHDSDELIKNKNIFHGGFNFDLHGKDFTGEVMDITKNYIVVKFKGNGHDNRDYLQLGYKPSYLTIVSSKKPKEHLLTQIL